MKKFIYRGCSILTLAGALWFIIYSVAIFPKLMTREYVLLGITIIKICFFIVFLLSISVFLAMETVTNVKIKKRLINIYLIGLGIPYAVYFLQAMFNASYGYTEIQLLPFIEICKAVGDILQGEGEALSAAWYIFYNLVIFVPMGMYLYWYVDKAKDFKIYFSIMSISIIFCNIVQYCLHSASLRTDSILLAVLGVVITYLLIEKFQNYLQEKE